MIAGWMVFAVAVGVALTLAALATEHASRMLGARPDGMGGGDRRHGGLAGYRVLPASTAHPAVSGPPAPLLPFTIDVTRMVPATAPAAGSALGALNAVLLTGWALWPRACSAPASCWRSGAWPGDAPRGRIETVEGEPVRVSADLGPAVVGVFRPEIVLPEWTLSLDGAFRT